MIELAYRQGSLRFALSSGGVNYRVQAHASVLNAMKHAEQRKAWPHHICSSLRTDNAAFHGTPDWSTAARLATRGWPEGRSMLRKAAAVMPKPPTAIVSSNGILQALIRTQPALPPAHPIA